MYDAGKVITGLVIFIGFMTYPFWHSIGGVTKIPELKKPVDEKKCVEPVEYMRAEHMKILDDWRNSVVRDGKRDFVSPEGRNFEMSLQKTCMKCHASKKDFCDKCHTYAGVRPYCWTCHVEPKEEAV